LRAGFGALLLGYFRSDGKLVYAGRVGTGFGTRLLEDLASRLKRIERPKSAFADFPRGSRRGIHWVKPELVAQIEFSNWTDEGLLRQASFQGLREDKSAREVKIERPVDVPS
jgi:bifunctional non-homologous end joining protein LigD